MSPPAKTTEEGDRARERTDEFRALVLSRSEKDDSDDKEAFLRVQRKDDGDSYAILLSKEVSKAALNAQMLARTTSRAIKRDQLNVYFNFEEKEDAKKEQIRDSIEREIVECVREMQNHVNRCEEIIKNGETKMMREESLRRSFGQKKRQQFVAHLHGIALITSEKIEEVAKTLDWMRARRFREQAEKAKRLERRRGGDARVGVEAVAKDLMMVKKQTAMPARRRTAADRMTCWTGRARSGDARRTRSGRSCVAPGCRRVEGPDRGCSRSRSAQPRSRRAAWHQNRKKVGFTAD